MSAEGAVITTRYRPATRYAGARIVAHGLGARRIHWWSERLSNSENHWAAAQKIIREIVPTPPERWAAGSIDENRCVFIPILASTELRFPTPVAELPRAKGQTPGRESR